MYSREDLSRHKGSHDFNFSDLQAPCLQLSRAFSLVEEESIVEGSFVAANGELVLCRDFKNTHVPMWTIPISLAGY